MDLTKISSSSYDCYSSCEWKWFLTYVLGFEDVSGPAAFVGQIVHLALENMSKMALSGNYDIDVIKIWEDAFNEMCQKSPMSSSDIKPDKIKKACDGIKWILKSDYSPIRDNTITLEQYFKIPVEDERFIVKQPNGEFDYLNLTGLIDRVDRIDDNTIEIIDYKTGQKKHFTSDKPIDESVLRQIIQPNMYHFASRKLFPEYDNIIVTYIYLFSKEVVSVPFIKEDIEGFKNNVLKRIRNIESNEDPQQTITWKCKRLCWFGKSGICKHVWDEKEKFGKDFVESKYKVLNDR